MRIEIDQSGRVEYTSVPTVLADSHGNSILLRGIDKQYLQKLYRGVKKPRMFVVEIFAFMIASIILKSYSPKTNHLYIIDT